MKWSFSLVVFLFLSASQIVHAQEKKEKTILPSLSIGWNSCFISGDPVLHNFPHEKYGFKAIDGDYFTPDKTDLPGSFKYPISIYGGLSLGTKKSNSFFIGLGYNRYKLEQESHVFLRYADMISPGKGFVMASRFNFDGGYHLYQGFGIQCVHFFHDELENIPIKMGLGLNGQWITSKYFLNHTDATTSEKWDFSSRDIELKHKVIHWAPLAQIEGQVFESEQIDLAVFTNFQFDVSRLVRQNYFGHVLNFGIKINR